jgi:hypothetical protein
VFKTHNSTRDFATGNSDVSKRVHQLCVIITEAEEENNNEGSKRVDRQVDKIKENNKKEKGESSRLSQRVEDHHISYQSWHRSTQRIEERSFNGISVRITPAQEETKRRKRHVFSR